MIISIINFHFTLPIPKMNLQRLVRKCIAGSYIIRAKALPSFSQAGEDVIVHYLFHQLKIAQPYYLDIGVNFPVAGNNTYFFYNRGCKGVCIEPDPSLYELIKKSRPKDIIINAGIGFDDSKNAEFYIFPHPYTGWNTFSKEEAESRQQQTGVHVKEIKTLPLKSINEVIAANFNPHPNFISIDVEGLDLAILQTLDFEKFKPEVICAETITFSMDNKEEKRNDIIEFLKSKGYFVFADTHINTIFCRTDAYKKSF
jgi:FkbM family methyltransferase